MRALKGFTALPLMAASLCFLVGIGAASLFEKSTAFWLWLSAGCLALLLLLRLLSRTGLVLRMSGAYTFWLVCLLGVLLGAARYQTAQPDITPLDLAWYNDSGEPAEVVGVVIRPADVRDTHTQVTVRAEMVNLEEGLGTQTIRGRVLAYLPVTTEVHYGDRVRLWGLLQTPPEDEEFSYKDYLARQGIHSYMPYAVGEVLESGKGSPVLRGLYAFREKGLALIYRYLPDPEASLLAGIVLGYESGIPEDVDQAFKDTGTTHIIAISGFNITIVSGFISILFSRLLGERRGAVAAVIAISMYTILVGTDAAVVRAAIMGGFSLFARQVGRRQHGLNSLAITAGLMAVANPMVLWDVGFQLSFAATLGLIIFAEPWEGAVEGWMSRFMPAGRARRMTAPVSEYVLLTLAAQVTTLPLIAYHFGRLSLVSLPANIAILPAQPPVMVLGGLSVLAGSVVTQLGQVLAYGVYPFLTYTIRVVEWFARWDAGVRVIGEINLWVVFGFYLALFALTVYWEKIKETLQRNFRPVVVLAVLSVLVVLVWQVVLDRPDDQLHLSMLDVGGGEAVLIETPDGRFVLVGGGERASQLSEELGRTLPLFQRRLDVLVVAGTKREQLAALPATLPRYPPAQVWWAGDRTASRPARQISAWLTEEGISVSELVPGQSLDLGSGAELIVITADEQGAALLLVWDDFRCLLPVGGAQDVMSATEMRRLGVSVTAVMLGHSGEVESNPPEWLAASSPRVVLLSVDSLNRSGLPDEETLAAVSGVPVLRTDLHGSVELVTDGKQMWVYTEK